MTTFPIVWADRAGTHRDALGGRPGSTAAPIGSSPDGRTARACAVLRDNNWDVWTYDMDRGVGNAPDLRRGLRRGSGLVARRPVDRVRFGSRRPAHGLSQADRRLGRGGAAARARPRGLRGANHAGRRTERSSSSRRTRPSGGDDLLFLQIGVEDEVQPFRTTPFSEGDAQPSRQTAAGSPTRATRPAGPRCTSSSYPVPAGGKWQISDSHRRSQPGGRRAVGSCSSAAKRGVMSRGCGRPRQQASRRAKPEPLFSGPVPRRHRWGDGSRLVLPRLRRLRGRPALRDVLR